MASRNILLVFFSVLSTASGSAVAASTFLSVDEEIEHAAFNAYRLKHRREYKRGTAEYDMRKALFEQRSAEVHAHNSKEGLHWKEELNHFSDRTDAERKSVLGYVRGAASAERGVRGASLLQVSNSSTDLPEKKDWTEVLKSASNVRDQANCGSCWAVATTSVLEAHYEIYSAKEAGKLRSFSTQQTLECAPNLHKCGGTGGCEGATVELGMDYILKNGIATEEEAPYRGEDAKCSANSLAETSPAANGGAAFGLVGYHMLERNKDYALAEAVTKYGPVAITVYADFWYGYAGGVFHGCPKDVVLDHAVTLFGYGTSVNQPGASDSNMKNWVIRNSWGKDWGEKGFIRMLRTTDCGTDKNNQQGTGCEGDAKSVEVCGMCGMLYDSVVPHFRGSPGHGDSASLVSIDSAGLMRLKAANPH